MIDNNVIVANISARMFTLACIVIFFLIIIILFFLNKEEGMVKKQGRNMLAK